MRTGGSVLAFCLALYLGWQRMPGSAGLLHIVLFGILIPALVVKSRDNLTTRPVPPRDRHFTAVIVQLLVFLGISVWVGWMEHIPVLRPFELRWAAVGLATVMLAAGVVLMAPRWRRKVEERDPKAYYFMPRNGKERGLWALISLAAAVAEEVTYRAVLFALLTTLTGSAWIAALLASAAFGVSHMVQGAQSALIISAIALALHGLVALSGSIYLAIVVHFLYDLIAGFSYGRLGERYGYPPEGVTA